MNPRNNANQRKRYVLTRPSQTVVPCSTKKAALSTLCRASRAMTTMQVDKQIYRQLYQGQIHIYLQYIDVAAVVEVEFCKLRYLLLRLKMTII